MDKKTKNELFKVAIDHLFNEKKVKSQKEMAMKIGITEPALSRIMNNTRTVSDETIRKMNDAFGGIFNMAYFRGESTNFLLEDEAYYQQHPEDNPFHDFDEQLKKNAQKSEQPQQYVIPSAIDYSFVHETIAVLRQQVSDKNTQITDLRADKERLIKESDAKDATIADLRKHVSELLKDKASLQATIEMLQQREGLDKFIFPPGVADKKDNDKANV